MTFEAGDEDGVAREQHLGFAGVLGACPLDQWYDIVLYILIELLLFS